MPSGSVSTSQLRVALRWFVISFLIIAATWLAVVFWWRTTQRAVSTTDALVYMVVLPIGILVSVVAIRHSLLAKKSKPQAGVDQANKEASSVAQASKEDARAHEASLAIIGAWASTSLSSFGEELLEQLKERRTRPTPDDVLIDEHGFPLLSGRMHDLDTSSVEADLATANMDITDASIESTDGTRDALLRALAILDSLLARIAEDWPGHGTGAAFPSDQPPQAMTLRGLPESASTPEGLYLQVKLLLSSELDAAEVRTAQAYIAQRLSAYGISASRISIDVVLSDDAPTAMKLADEFRMTANAAPGRQSPRALLLLSSVSNLCSTIAEEWESQGLIFSSQRPNGRMLGEAAFGVLCANENVLGFTAGAAPMCHLTPAVFAQRSSAGQDRTKEDVLANAICTALGVAKLAGDEIGTVVCDADHRSDRTLESIGAMISQAPKLDAIHDRLSIDEACGHLGPASALGIMAVGALHAAQALHPVLLFNVGHPTERAVALLRPVGLTEDCTSSRCLQAA